MKQGLLFKMISAMAVASLPTQLWAGAFANTDLTAAGAGVANAVVASADDAAAAVYNPAGLAWQEGVQLLIGSQSRYRTLTVDQAGISAKGDANLTDLSAFAMAWLPESSDWGASVAMVTPFAARTNWNGAFTAPADIAEMNLRIQRYSVDAFHRINNALAFSLGADWYDGSMTLNSGGSNFSGSDTGGLAGHLGLRWQFQPFWTFGATYRQASSLNFTSGNAASLALNLPAAVTVALMHDVADTYRFELDVKQTAWSGVQDLNVLQQGVGSQLLKTNLRDATQVMLGATLFWRDNTQLRAGYAFTRSANQASGFQPAIADLTGHKITAGFGGMMSDMHLDVAWTGVFYQDRKAAGTWAGTYKDAQFSLMFSLSKTF